MKTYLIAANTNSPFDPVKFHNFIVGLYPKHLSSWWHYLPGSIFLVQTNLPLNQLNSLVSQHMGGLQFLIIEVNPDQSQGWLPKEAWKWLGRG